MPALRLLSPRKGAPARPSRITPYLAAGVLTAAFAVGDASLTAPAASAGGSVAQFERLARCESGGNWAINTGNGYYGGLQFNLATWRGLGLGGYPHRASKAQQIAAGQKLHSQRGWKPWPACSRKLGLRGDGGVRGSGAAAPVVVKPLAKPAAPAPVRTARASRSRPVAPTRGRVAAPAFDGHVMTVADVRTYRSSVRTWQRQMSARGYRLRADGLFGPRSAAAARRLAAATGTAVTPGTVNAALWAATWTAPVR